MTAATPLSFETLATGLGARTAIIDGAKSISYQELDRCANRIANGLRAAGLRAGDRVAYLGRNSAVCSEVLLACARAGLVLVFLNWRLSPDELSYVLEDCDARAVIVAEDYADLVAMSGAGHVDLSLTVGGHSDDWAKWLSAQSPLPTEALSSSDDILLQLYTSGTTGLPKGALLSRAALALTMSDLVALWNLDRDSVALAVLPMFHISGIGSVLTSMMAGATLVVGHDPSPAGIAATIEKQGVTHVVLVTSLLTGLLGIDGADDRLSSLRTISYGAAPITDEALGQAINLFGCDLVQIYGLTESTGVLTALTSADHRAIRQDPACRNRLRSCGRARPGIGIRIADPVTGSDLPPGGVGEIQARTERVMSGYWKQADATSQAISPDGWLRTGDLGTLDSDGYLYLHDRLRDMIISGGENVYPAEVENALQWHPAVADVAVIGIPDRRWGETPHAVVVLREGGTATEQDLIQFARSRLAHYKCPTSASFVESLPRNATGKVLRRELRDPHWASYERRIN